MTQEFNALQSHEQASAIPTTATRSEHGLLTEALDTTFHAIFGDSKEIKEDANAEWGVANLASGFVKAVPLFMGPGRGLVLSAVLHGIDEVHRGDSTSTQLADFALGSAKGAGTKLVLDKFGASDISLAQKGLAIGGGSSFLDSTLTRKNWINQTTGEVDFSGGLQKAAFQTAFGAGVGMAAFPLGHALASKITPTAQRFFGSRINDAMVASATTGGAFGLTGGIVGESANQFYSGSFDPVAIAKRGIFDGLSTAAAGGVGYRFSAHYALNPNRPNMKRSEPDPDGNRDRPNPEPKEPRNNPSANSEIVSSQKIDRNSPQTDGVISEPKSNKEPVLTNENTNNQFTEPKATLEAQTADNPLINELLGLKKLGISTHEQDVRLAHEIKIERNKSAYAAWEKFNAELKTQNMDEVMKHLLKTYEDFPEFSRMREIANLKATGTSTPEQNAELEAFLLFRDPKIQDLARRETLGISTPEESALVNAARQSLKQKFNLPADATLKDIVYELTAWRLRATDERFMIFR